MTVDGRGFQITVEYRFLDPSFSSNFQKLETKVFTFLPTEHPQAAQAYDKSHSTLRIN